MFSKSVANQQHLQQDNSSDMDFASLIDNDELSETKSQVDTSKTVQFVTTSNENDNDHSEDETAHPILHPNTTESQVSIHEDTATNRFRSHFLLQVFFSVILSGLGMVIAGVVLVQAQKLHQFVPAMLLILPTLMGLKGNLEMTLASRLSTEANLGNLDERSTSIHAVISNLTLVQVQAVVVSLVASLLCVIMSKISQSTLTKKDFILVMCSSLSTSTIASLLTGTIVCGIILLSRFYNFNADNVATPVAAGLGDFSTLVIMVFASILYSRAYDYDQSIIVTSLLMHSMFFIAMLGWTYYNHWTRHTLLHGWAPIFIAMLISNLSGFILKRASSIHKSMLFFVVTMNGTTGNMVAIQASRLCTKLMRIDSILKNAEDERVRTISGYVSMEIANKPRTPVAIRRVRRSVYHEEVQQFRHLLTSPSTERSPALLLILDTPLCCIFLLFMSWIFPHDGFQYNVWFFLSFLIAATALVTTLQFLCGYVAVFIWQLGHNPDNACVPILTAIGDLLGTSLLWLIFIVDKKFFS